MSKPSDIETFFGGIRFETDPEMPTNQIDIIDHHGRRPLIVNIGPKGISLDDQLAPLSTPTLVTLHHLNHARPLRCDLCREQIGWTWEFSAPTMMVYCSSCKDAPPSRLVNAAKDEEKGLQ